MVVCATAALAIQIVRNAAVNALAPAHPDEAAKFWSGHPATELSLGMTAIATASRNRKPVPREAFGLIRDAAEKSPLSPEPFLVRGVQSQLGGDPVAAQRDFEAAQWRDPRSLPAAYFLADRYFQTGDTTRGLSEVAVLARLAPYGTATVAPYLAQYAEDPANWPRLRQLFIANPELADPTLARLASNPTTVPAVMALVNGRRNVRDAPWLAPLLSTLVSTGSYAEARSFWARASGHPVKPVEVLHDAGFTDSRSPPPFNWALTSSTVGTVERQGGGRLHIVFYGQEDGILASQLLLLQPGAYHLSMQLLGDPAHAKALTWSLWCDKADAPTSSVTLEAAAASGWTFQVPAACPAQWLRLSASSSDLSQQSDFSIAGLKLQRALPGA